LLDTDIDQYQSRLLMSKTKTQAMKLSELIDHILVLNKLEEGSGYYKTENVPIFDVIRGVVDSMRIKLESKEMQVKIDIDEKLVLRANRILLHSIYQNLIILQSLFFFRYVFSITCISLLSAAFFILSCSACSPNPIWLISKTP